ncbi:MAG: IclR family transcriptional regulator [Rubrobacteraceae bacterium]
MLQTLSKAGRVLDLFSLEKPEWGVSEVAKSLGIPKSGAHTLLISLADQGMLRRTDKARYRLGWRVMAMNQILLETTDFRPEAQRTMEYLVSRFGETIHLAALESGQVIYVDKRQGTRAVRVAVTGTGVRLPAHGSGVGKALLAHRPWEEVLKIVEKQGMAALTPKTITGLDEFRDELEVVRERGYAFDLEETIPELCCVASPIKDRTEEVVASISFSVPAYRFESGRERYVSAIVQAARNVSESIGYFGPVSG